MSRPIAEIIGYVSSALGIVAFIVSAFELNSSYLRKGLWLGMLVSAIVAAASFFKVSHDKASRDLKRISRRVGQVIHTEATSYLRTERSLELLDCGR